MKKCYVFFDVCVAKHYELPLLCKIAVKWKDVVFFRCQIAYEQRDVAVRGDAETQKKLHSFVLFLGELYLNLEVRGSLFFQKLCKF